MTIASLAWLQRTLLLVRLRPFDISTPQGRANERHRRVALSAFASALAKILSVSTALISVPLTLHYLGAERYGMWMTMSSVIAMLGFADLGIGNGVLTAVARAHGNDDREAIRRCVSSALFVLSLIAVVILLTFTLSYSFVPWHRIFNVDSQQARDEAAPALAIFVLCFAVAIPIGIVQRVQMGLQLGFVASLWQCVASTMGLAGVLIAIHMEAGLPFLVLAFVGAPLLASLMNSLLFFGRLQRDIAPRRSSISKPAVRQVVRAGSLFLVLQIVMAVAYSSDSIIIAQTMGAEAVGQYTVPEKLFSLVSLAIVMVLSPLWPAYGEAIAKGDTAWVRSTLKRSLLTALCVSALLCTFLVIAGTTIIAHWVGPAVQPSFALLIALGIWKTIESTASAVAMYLNASNVLKLQLWSSFFTVIIAIPLKVSLTHLLGISGTTTATIVAYTLCSIIPMLIFLPRYINARHPAAGKRIDM